VVCFCFKTGRLTFYKPSDTFDSVSERLEHELHLLNDKVVSVVRPGYGTQSDCWCGNIHSLTETYPVRFHFISVGKQIIFEVGDVVRIDPPKNPTDERNNHPTIRLKGPQDYASRQKAYH
jgi:hypothetical protein